MAGVARGEIRRVRPWPYVGSEASGGRPALVVSPTAFHASGYAIVVPLTTPGPNHTHWWEPHISATDSRALVPDVKTVPVTLLDRDLRVTAIKDDLHAVRDVLRRLLGGNEPTLASDVIRGDVWRVAYPGTEQGSRMDVLVLRYNEGNDIAMTMVVTDKPRNPSDIVLPVVSCPALSGRSVLASQVISLSVGHRFKKRFGRLSATEVDAAAGAFMKLMP